MQDLVFSFYSTASKFEEINLHVPVPEFVTYLILTHFRSFFTSWIRIRILNADPDSGGLL